MEMVLRPVRCAMKWRGLCGIVAIWIAIPPEADASPRLAGARMGISQISITSLQKPPARAKAKQGNAKGGKGAKNNPNSALAVQANAAAGEAASARENAQAAAKAVQEVMAEMRKLEGDLIEAQSEDSPLGQVKTRLEKLQEERKKEMERILQSPEYQSALARLGGVGERRAEDVAKLRDQMVNQNDVMVSISADLKMASVEFQSLKKKILEEDVDWKAAVENVSSLRKEQAAADADARKALTQKLRAEDIVEQAQRQARIAALMKQQQAWAKKRAEAVRKQQQQQQQRNRQRQRRR